MPIDAQKIKREHLLNAPSGVMHVQVNKVLWCEILDEVTRLQERVAESQPLSDGISTECKA